MRKIIVNNNEVIIDDPKYKRRVRNINSKKVAERKEKFKEYLAKFEE